MTDDNFSSVLSGMLPKGLDDIIRQNRDHLQLRLASEAELNSIAQKLVVKNLKGTLTEAFIYNRVSPSIEKPILCLVGFDEADQAFHTSSLVGFDPENNTVLTMSGSNYLIKSFATGEPDFLLLAHICYMLHRNGIGDFFGVPQFTY